MGKHRGGDPTKSLRFARKALDLYTQGLSKYPQNFDLAYNKARLELEIATHPSLVKALDVPVTQVLEQALTSHRFAISLNPENADTLFNTAQVLTTIAEYVAKDDSIPDTEALSYLEEALERQDQCLQIQQARFAESRGLHEAAMSQNLHAATADDDDIEDDDGGAKLDQTTTSAFEDQSQDQDQQEQWVSIIEPVTADTLIDTILSQLSTLTTLCTLLTSSLSTPSTSPITPSWIESYSTGLISNTLPTLTSDPQNTELLLPRASEIHRTKAIFSASLLDLAFHTNSITPETYIANLTQAFSTNDLNGTEPQQDPETQIAYARALITLNSSLSELPPQPQPTTSSSSSSSASTTSPSTHRWTILSRATTLLTTTSQYPTTKADPQTHATTHLLRGDIALLLYALSRPPISHPQAISNKAQLLKNAEVFYRNAAKLLTSAGGEGFLEGAVARWRGGMVEVLKLVDESGGSENVDREMVRRILDAAGRGEGGEWRREQMGEMVDEGLLEGADLPL